jgi:Sulfotransferase family
VNLRPALHRNRRALPLVLAAPLLPPRALPREPIFVIGCPRSGTTVVFELLRRAAAVRSIGQEGHVLWETFHHPREHGWRSNALGAEDVRSFEPRYLAHAIATLARPRGAARFVDKTPRNVLRLPYLDALFPDARYVFVQRDGRAVVSSLVVAWRERSVTRDRPAYVLPVPFTIPGIPERQWHFILPPGWRELDGHPLEEVCAHQYVTSVEAMLEFRSGLDPARATELRYEELLASPAEALQRLHASLGLPYEDADADRARRTVRAPEGRPKWTVATPEEVERVLPRIEPTLAATGYP